MAETNLPKPTSNTDTEVVVNAVVDVLTTIGKKIGEPLGNALSNGIDKFFGVDRDKND